MAFDLADTNAERRRIARHDLDPQHCWMVGDRHMDIHGARHHGMPSVGVLWGFGGEAELREAGATHLALSPAGLRGLFAAVAC